MASDFHLFHKNIQLNKYYSNIPRYMFLGNTQFIKEQNKKTYKSHTEHKIYDFMHVWLYKLTFQRQFQFIRYIHFRKLIMNKKGKIFITLEYKH